LQPVGPGTEADFLGVLELDRWIQSRLALLGQAVSMAPGSEIEGRLVDRDRIGGGQYADVRHDRFLPAADAVTPFGHIDEKVEKETPVPLVPQHTQGMLGYPLLKIRRLNSPIVADRVEIAHAEAFAAADALLLEDEGLLLFLYNSVNGAPLEALPAEGAGRGIDVRLDRGMLAQLADPAGQTHAEVLDTGPEAHPGVSGGMRDGEERIGEYDLPGDVHFVEDDPVDRHFDLCVSGQTVGHDEGGAGPFVGKSVIEGLNDVIHGVGAPALVKGAGFRQEGESGLLFHSGDNGFDEIRRDVGIVIVLAHVELYRHLVLGFDDVSEFRSFDQLHCSGQPFPMAAAVGKLDENDSGFLDGGSS